MGKFLAIMVLIQSLSLLRTDAQRPEVLDSLETLLKVAHSGEAKVDILNNLAYEYYDYKDSVGLAYAKIALKEATHLKYLNGIKYSYILVGVGYLSKSDHKTAIDNLRKSYQTKLSVPDSKGLALYALSLLGNVYRTVSKYDSAIYYYNLARLNFDEVNKDQWAILYKNRALLHLRLWQNNLALKYLDSASFYLNAPKNSVLSLDIWAAYGVVYQNLLQNEKAETYFDLACNNRLVEQAYFSNIKCKLNRTRSAYRKGEYPLALSHAIDALKLLDYYSYPPQKVEVLTRIAEIYIELGEYALANRFFIQALTIAEQHDFVYERAYILGELAWVFKDQGNYKLALDYLRQSQQLREQIGDTYGIAICHNIRGLIYLLQKKYQQSIDEHGKAKSIREELGHTEGVAASIFNISLVYLDQGFYDKALQYQLEAIALEERFDNKQGLAISYDYVASVFIKKGNLKEAEAYLNKCRALANQTNSKLLKRNNAGYFAQLYEAKGDYKNALAYQKLYQALNDSVYSQSIAGKLAEMQALYQLDKMERQIKLLDNENALKETNLQYQKIQLKQQRMVILAALLVVFLISGVAFIVYRYYKKVKLLNRAISERNEEIQAQSEELTESNEALVRLNHELAEQREEIQAQSEELREANETITEVNRSLEHRVEERTSELRQAYKELDTFFYRSSHDFRRPLTTFMGLAEVARVTVKDQHALELFSKVNETAHYLDKMLFKLQSISDLGAQEIVFKEVFIKDIFDNVCDLYRADLQERHIKTSCSIKLKEPFHSYPALLKIIFENLLENSIFFYRKEEPSPYISLTVYESLSEVIFEFEDNGQGIGEDFHDRIFEMYFRGSERSKGNGLGLYIVKKAIEKLGGTISLESTIDKGSMFKLVFKKP